MIEFKCDWCGGKSEQQPSQYNKNNSHFCCNECRLNWNANNFRENVNKPGHTKGVERPHLSEYNKTKNPMNTSEGWDLEKRLKDREQTIKQFSGKNKQSYEKLFGIHVHRIIAEKKIGRQLKENEIVHHIDEDIRNNSPENLAVMTQAEHASLHFSKE